MLHEEGIYNHYSYNFASTEHSKNDINFNIKLSKKWVEKFEEKLSDNDPDLIPRDNSFVLVTSYVKMKKALYQIKDVELAQHLCTYLVAVNADRIVVNNLLVEFNKIDAPIIEKIITAKFTE